MRRRTTYENENRRSRYCNARSAELVLAMLLSAGHVLHGIRSNGAGLRSDRCHLPPHGPTGHVALPRRGDFGYLLASEENRAGGMKMKWDPHQFCLVNRPHGTGKRSNKISTSSRKVKKFQNWSQNSGYGSYRVWVDNTTSQRMTVTITSRSASDQHTFYVPANSSKTYTVNDAVSGNHTITFATVSGDLSGTVRVRVSEEPL